jgi:hypothetical protein
VVITFKYCDVELKENIEFPDAGYMFGKENMRVFTSSGISLSLAKVCKSINVDET